MEPTKGGLTVVGRDSSGVLSRRFSGKIDPPILVAGNIGRSIITRADKLAGDHTVRRGAAYAVESLQRFRATTLRRRTHEVNDTDAPQIIDIKIRRHGVSG
jgi:hypothetical protein